MVVVTRAYLTFLPLFQINFKHVPFETHYPMFVIAGAIFALQLAYYLECIISSLIVPLSTKSN